MTTFRHTVRFLTGRIALLAITLLFSFAIRAAVPHPEALAAWDDRVKHVKLTLDHDAQCQQPEVFLVSDKKPELREHVVHGKVAIVHPAKGGMVHVPSGLIHDWTGVVFIPGARAADVLRVLQDYDNYARSYRPAVASSRFIGRSGPVFRYQLKFEANSFGVKAGLRGDFESHYTSINRNQGFSITEASRLVELENTGTADERELSSNEAHGYIERMLTVVRYLEAGDGVVVEVEAMTLSRDVPGAVRWVIAPLIERFSRQVLAGTLEKFRARVQAEQELTSRAAVGGLP
jgi:hypothetical protein